MTTPASGIITFNKRYFAIAVAIFIIELLIAVFVRDRFVRPYVGDVLVVILLYCFVRSFVDRSPVIAAVGVLIFACGIETLQYFRIVEILGLEQSGIARTVIGTRFVWMDLVAYTAGALIVLAGEYYVNKRTGKIP